MASTLQQLSISATTVQLQGLSSNVQNSIDDLVPITTSDSTDLQANYTTIIGRIKTTVAGANSSDPGALTTQLHNLQSQVRAYDTVRNGILNAYVSGNTNFFSAVITEFKYYCTAIIYILGPIFGFIVMTNVFFDEPTIILKLFYGFWGALWYPLTILFAVIDPPVWRALIIPITMSDVPFFFLEFWKYQSIDPETAIESNAKSQTMVRLMGIGLFVMFMYCFFL